MKITYSKIESLLRRFDADLDAAEAHGLASGMLCLDESITPQQWLNELFQQSPELSEADFNSLSLLFMHTRATLMSDDFEYYLLLPSDESPLSIQTEALSNWCRGFLFGIGFAHSTATWPGDSGEILKDFIEFTKLDTHAYDEGDEQAFVEINEYCRAAVMLLRDDLRGNKNLLH